MPKETVSSLITLGVSVLLALLGFLIFRKAKRAKPRADGPLPQTDEAEKKPGGQAARADGLTVRPDELVVHTGERDGQDEEFNAGAGERAAQDEEFDAGAGERAAQDEEFDAGAGERAAQDEDLTAQADEWAAQDEELTAQADEWAAQDEDFDTGTGDPATQDKELAAKADGQAKREKKKKRRVMLGYILMAFGGWLFIVTLLPLIFGQHAAREFTVEISPPRYPLFGFDLSSTVIITWLAMALLLILALLARIFAIPRFKDKPRGLQNLLETMVEGISQYTESKAGGMGDNLGAYLFSIAALMTASAGVEFFGLRAPTADITMTFAFALITFILINYYGVKKKGVGGRIKSLASPTPVVFPIRVVSDFALPISMACRLFGNMLGGMIVMELLYSALGSGAIALPSIVGLYFNIFHPLIQIFIFVTLSLTFINEAAE